MRGIRLAVRLPCACRLAPAGDPVRFRRRSDGPSEPGRPHVDNLGVTQRHQNMGKRDADRQFQESRRGDRKRGTPAETAMWKMLDRKQVDGRRFRRQHAFGPYVLDFYCPAEQLAVEVEGTSPGEDRAALEAYLKEHGVTFLSFDNRAVFEDPEGTLAAIRAQFSDEESADE
jgi:very-short-patch-repair endonuclease